jgi:hypothetical protein
MKEYFGERLDVQIYTLDAAEAKPYSLEFRGSTNVRLDNEWVPLNVAIDKTMMEAFLAARLSTEGEI